MSLEEARALPCAGGTACHGVVLCEGGGKAGWEGGIGWCAGDWLGGGGEYVCDFRYVLWFETDESCCAHGVDVCVSFCGLFFG